MTAELRVYCEVRDVDNIVLHRTDVANLVQDPVVGGPPAVGIFLRQEDAIAGEVVAPVRLAAQAQ